jgi:H+-transporting ATPase
MRWVADRQLQDMIKLGLAQLQTVMFLQLAVGGHLLLFVVRTRRSLFEPPYPSVRLFWAILATQIVAVCLLETGEIPQ